MKTRTTTNLKSLLDSGLVRKIDREERQWFAVVDLVRALMESEFPAEVWNDLKTREPALACLVELVDLPNPETGLPESVEVVDLAGAFRVVQAIPSRKAERIKQWIADVASQRLAESEDPELAVLRARHLYQQRGYSRQWVDSRLSSTSARQDLAGEWYRRGARESDQFRELTNELMRSAFGMDVEHYREFKHLRGARNLRDHMTDLELVLTRLSEMTAAALHRDRNSSSFEELKRDVQDAGELTAKARNEIEHLRGKPIIYPGSFAA
jgi:hypothetical protein